MIEKTPLFRAATTVVAVLGVCVLACASSASAFTPVGGKASGENTPLNLTSPSTSSHSSTGSASIVRTIVGLAIVIAVIWGLTWILRQVKSAKEGGARGVGAGGLQSVAQIALSSGRSVHLVRAGNDYVLVGSSEQGVVGIHRYSEQQAREAGLLSGPPALEGGRPFAGSSAAPADWSQVPPGTAPASARWSGQGPMGAGGAPRSTNLVERLREWTVRK
jgi:flagellar protein FliO/FliZ